MIGPGRLVLIAGPSGAGKDTLIDGARATLKDNPKVFFPRRVVTRASSAAETHDSMTDAHFDCARLNGDFAFWWEAHGHKYAIPATINDRIRAGHTVACNVSRTAIKGARDRYSEVLYVLITAPAEVLAARLASRNRESDSKSLDRASRIIDAGIAPDEIIDNAGTPEAGIQKLADILTRSTPR